MKNSGPLPRCPPTPPAKSRASHMAADEFAAATEAAYQICAAKLQEEVDGVLRQTNRTSFQKIQAFLERNSSSGGDGDGGGSSSEGFSQSPYTELPVALVHAGCNTADHALTLRQLLHHLKMNCSPHLAVLRSKECGTVAATTRWTDRGATLGWRRTSSTLPQRRRVSLFLFSCCHMTEDSINLMLSYEKNFNTLLIHFQR